MTNSKPPTTNPPDGLSPLAGYAVDLHDLTLLVPTDRPAQPGATAALELRGRDGLRLRAVGRVESITPASEGRQAAMALRLLDVRALHEQPLILMESLRPPSLAPAAKTGALRVLVVDDDATLRGRACGAMRAAGFEVLEAQNGAEALSVAKREAVDLVLTDVNMPVMDGWQLLRMVRAQDDLRHLPVIFLTTLLSERDRMRGYAQGVDDYIDKPFEIQDLVGRVERLLQRGHTAQQAGSEERTLHGDLARVSLGSLLAFLEADRHSGVLRLTRGASRAEIGLRDGLVCGVTIRPVSDEDEDDLRRLFRLLDWADGEFDLQAGAVDSDGELGLPMTYVLLEHARLKDMAAHGRAD